MGLLFFRKSNRAYFHSHIKNGTYKVLECNPRVQGTMVVSSLAGANIIRMSIEELVLNKFDHDYNIDWDTKFERFWGGYGIRKGEFLEI